MSNHQDDNEYDEKSPGVTAESYGAVDVCTDDVWLLRIPPKLAQAFEAAPEGSVLGDLVFTKGGVGKDGKTIKPAFTVHVSEELSEAAVASSATATEGTPSHLQQQLRRRLRRYLCIIPYNP